MSAIVDGGNVVLCRPQDSYIENPSTGQRSPMSGRKGVFVMQLKAQAGADAKMVRFDEPNSNSVFRRLAWTKMWKNFVNVARPRQRQSVI